MSARKIFVIYRLIFCLLFFFWIKKSGLTTLVVKFYSRHTYSWLFNRTIFVLSSYLTPKKLKGYRIFHQKFYRMKMRQFDSSSHLCSSFWILLWSLKKNDTRIIQYAIIIVYFTDCEVTLPTPVLTLVTFWYNVVALNYCETFHFEIPCRSRLRTISNDNLVASWKVFLYLFFRNTDISLFLTLKTLVGHSGSPNYHKEPFLVLIDSESKNSKKSHGSPMPSLKKWVTSV